MSHIEYQQNINSVLIVLQNKSFRNSVKESTNLRQSISMTHSYVNFSWNLIFK